MCALCHTSFSRRCRTLLPFTCPDDLSLACTPNEICDEVRFCRLQRGHQENHTEHRVAREKIARSRSTRSNRGRAQVRTSTAHDHGTRATSVSGMSAEDVKIMVAAFLAERGVQANRKAWHNVMQSEHIQRMAVAHAQRPM